MNLTIFLSFPSQGPCFGTHGLDFLAVLQNIYGFFWWWWLMRISCGLLLSTTTRYVPCAAFLLLLTYHSLGFRNCLLDHCWTLPLLDSFCRRCHSHDVPLIQYTAEVLTLRKIYSRNTLLVATLQVPAMMFPQVNRWRRPWRTGGGCHCERQHPSSCWPLRILERSSTGISYRFDIFKRLAT